MKSMCIKHVRKKNRNSDQILATSLFSTPSMEIRASSTISQRLAEAFQANTEATTPIPEYLR